MRGLEPIVEITRALGGEIDLERILELIVKRGRALVERPRHGARAHRGTTSWW